MPRQPARPASPVATVTTGPTTTGYVIGTNGSLYGRPIDGAASLTDLGGIALYGPGAVSWDGARTDVFVVGTNRELYHRWGPAAPGRAGNPWAASSPAHRRRSPSPRAPWSSSPPAPTARCGELVGRDCGGPTGPASAACSAAARARRSIRTDRSPRSGSGSERRVVRADPCAPTGRPPGSPRRESRSAPRRRTEPAAATAWGSPWRSPTRTVAWP
jgi:hypothetical protein